MRFNQNQRLEKSPIGGWRRYGSLTLLAGIVLGAAIAAVEVMAVEERPVHPPAPKPHPDAVDLETARQEIEAVLRDRLSIEAKVDSILAGIELPGVPAPLPADPTVINAVDITIDPIGGITVIDRDGKIFHRFGEVQIPPLPRGLGTIRLGDFREVTRGDIVHLGTDIVVEEDVLVDGSVTCVFCDVTIHGQVTGVVVSVFGDIIVDGSIGEDAVAPFGVVHVRSNGQVCCDVVGSQIRKEPGGRIGGMRSQILLEVFGSEWQSMSRFWTQTTLTALVILKVLFWLFLALLAHALACRNIVKVKRKIETSPIKAFFVGLAAQILFLPLVLILIVTIVGIPVAVFLVPLLVVAGLVLAYAAAGLFLGEKIDQNTGIRLRNPLSQTMVGLFLLQSISLAWLAVFWLSRSWGGGGSLRLMAFVLGGFSLFIGYVVLTVGSGAVVMTRFGTRPKGDVPCEPEDATGTEGSAASTTSPTPLPNTTPGPRPEEPGAAPAVG